MLFSSTHASFLTHAIAYALLGALPLACSGPGNAPGGGPVRDSKSQLAEVSPGPVDQLAASVVGASFEGTLCPPESAMVLISQDQQAVGVNFSATLPGGEAPVTGGCTITIDIDVPDGHQLGFPRLTWHGVGAAATIARTYAFEGGALSPRLTSEVTPDLEIADRTELWSPCESSSRRVRFVAKVEATIHDPAGFFELIDLQVDTWWRAGTDWRNGCGATGTLVTAPPGAIDAWCAGPQARACQPDLRCEMGQEVEAYPRLEGTCVDPGSAVSSRGRGETCGGFRHIPCVDGLVCWARGQTTLDNGWLGRCFPETHNTAGTPCGIGIPVLSCDADNRIHCDLTENLCKMATGERFSPCGAGLPECNSGLICSAPERGNCVRDSP